MKDHDPTRRIGIAVSVAGVVGSFCTSREQARRLGRLLSLTTQRSKLTIDFSGVSFMSRSFADELYKQVHRIGGDRIVHTVHARRAVSEMLHAVSVTQQRGPAVRDAFRFLCMTDCKRLSQYLLSLD